MNEPWMYIVLLGLLFLVLAFTLPKRRGASADSVPPGMLKEIEETMDGFLAEIEEDNGKLLQTLAQMKHDHELAMRKQANRTEELEKRIREQDQEIKRLAIAVQAASSVGPAAPAAAVIQKEEAAELAGPVGEVSSIAVRFPELFELHDTGKSVEYIAKKLAMNKGEVSLILQLAKQEGREGAER